MRFLGRTILFAGLLAILLVPRPAHSKAQTSAPRATGAIVGHVTLTGRIPANPAIRMGVDPVCAAMSRAARPVQEFVVKGADGGLANVVVKLDGTFPRSPVPSQPVTVTQQNCIYGPRVVAGRVGQTLMVVNRDMTLHNIQSITKAGNTFNTTQPRVGMVFSYVLKAPEIFRLKCDVHAWMTGYVAAIDHPYFAVTKDDGAFTIARVPAGRQAIHLWHEAFGELTRMITVKPGETVTVDFAYPGSARGAAQVRELLIPQLVASPHHAE